MVRRGLRDWTVRPWADCSWEAGFLLAWRCGRFLHRGLLPGGFRGHRRPGRLRTFRREACFVRTRTCALVVFAVHGVGVEFEWFEMTVGEHIVASQELSSIG